MKDVNRACAVTSVQSPVTAAAAAGRDSGVDLPDADCMTGSSLDCLIHSRKQAARSARRYRRSVEAKGRYFVQGDSSGSLS